MAAGSVFCLACHHAKQIPSITRVRAKRRHASSDSHSGDLRAEKVCVPAQNQQDEPAGEQNESHVAINRLSVPVLHGLEPGTVWACCFATVCVTFEAAFVARLHVPTLWRFTFHVMRGRFSASLIRVFYFCIFCSFRWDDYTVQVRINDYLDIVCPHYKRGEVSSQQAERYVLYMVDLEDYEACKPHSFDQLRWECSRPFAAHAPEKFSEKFQRFTPFTLGKEFRQGESYYYISKPLHQHGESCLRLKVDVVGPHGSKNHKKTTEKEEETEAGKPSHGNAGGVHNPSNRLPADDPAAMIPVVQRSVGSSAVPVTPASSFFTLLALVLLLVH